MKILCLHNNECALELFDWIRSQGHEVVVESSKLNKEWCISMCFDLTVSYTYRYILSQEIIKALNNNVVNLHNSFLPFNRGASPNIWSIVEGTPRGVTLHYIDKELDKGYIIAQRLAIGVDADTLVDSYCKLDRLAKELFKEAFYYYNYWCEMKKIAMGRGTYHGIEDYRQISDMITSYNITGCDLICKIKDSGRSLQGGVCGGG